MKISSKWHHHDNFSISATRSNLRFRVCITNGFDYHQTSNISLTKCQHLNVSHLVLQLSFPNPLKPDFKSRMLEQRRWALLQLHLSEQQFLLEFVTKVRLILEVWRFAETQMSLLGRNFGQWLRRFKLRHSQWRKFRQNRRFRYSVYWLYSQVTG